MTILSNSNSFLNHAASPEIYTLSLHDALPIYPIHGAHRLQRVLPRRGFGREHHGVRAVEDGVRHVRGLGARGPWMVDHRLEHLRGGDDRLAAPVRLPDEALLHDGDFLERQLHAQVAPSHHPRLRRGWGTG